MGPDTDERAVSERDLAAVACKDVEPKERDHVDRDEGELEQPELPHEPRQERDHDDGKDEERRADRLAEDRPPAHQTRLTTRWPNRPCGRTSSTTSSTVNAAGSRSSPSVSPPTTAPTGLSIPPSTAAAKE